MKYQDILGESLKSDFLFDLFETYDVDVIYSYDRTYDNIEDEYHAAIPRMGLEFIFDASQRLRTIFMSRVEHSSFNPFEGNDPRIVPFSCGSEAVKFAEKRSIRTTHQLAKVSTFFGNIPEYVKFHFDKYFVHYEFSENGIGLVTLQLENA